jgi:hypothetical protein
VVSLEQDTRWEASEDGDASEDRISSGGMGERSSEKANGGNVAYLTPEKVRSQVPD